MEQDISKNQFIQLYTNESDAIYRFCLLRTSDKDVAVDLMQDTFMRFWNVLSQGEKKVENKRAFLFTVARNSIIDWYRKKKTLSLDALAEGSETDAETFMPVGQKKEDIEMTHEAKFLLERIRELDPLYQQVVYLRFVEGLGPKDIAEIIGESANVVSVRINRGLQQLRKVAGYDEEQP
ncbi:MAG: sigma-70 family RNA polymerase sigma factor [Candidatus Paceibacterota bacterium]|jgi:RNA polymerase sigma-70 factor (ECF subfamily)